MDVKPETAKKQREEAISTFGEERITALEHKLGLTEAVEETPEYVLYSTAGEKQLTIGVQTSVNWFTQSPVWKFSGFNGELNNFPKGELSEESKENLGDDKLFKNCSLFLFFKLKEENNNE